jgi:hypothetical protein
MSLVILKNVQNFLSNKNLHENAKFYSLVLLTNMELISNREFIEYSLNFFFDLFGSYAEKDDSYYKHLTLIVKRINMLSKYSADKVI